MENSKTNEQTQKTEKKVTHPPTKGKPPIPDRKPLKPGQIILND